MEGDPPGLDRPGELTFLTYGRMVDLTPQAFAGKWSRMALSERSSYHEHFRDLCATLGQPTPTDVDPDGSFYTFEV